MLIQELLDVSKILKLQGKLNICIDLCVCASVLVCWSQKDSHTFLQSSLDYHHKQLICSINAMKQYHT